ncbi:glycosyltransferase [Streptomyces sp. NPDC002809]|uniref:glycosyltransferase family 2 protein n=1 Tax=Streptomyces sp. NPDC002809 TaxID=3154433 RepID=UPI003320D691
MLGVIGAVGWAATCRLVINPDERLFLTIVYLVNAMLITYFVAAAQINRRHGRGPVAQGRVVAIVPAFEEEPALLEATIAALLRQTRPVDEIHVVDDGSVRHPLPSFDHPRVFLHRKDNAGKRRAQAHALSHLRREDWDFVMTVDSDSVVEDTALEYLLRAMSQPRVMAATGLVMTRNHDHNLLTRLMDLNVGTACLVNRASRSVFGVVETTSGALSLYRAPILFDNVRDYVSSGTAGDDRRLTMYALLRGQVIAVHDARVHSAMPTTIRDTFQQRVRWGKSAWAALPFAITNLSWKQLIAPLAGSVQWLFLPAVAAMVATGAFSGTHPLYLWTIGCSYVLVRYLEASQYVMQRPGMSLPGRLWRLLWATPAEILVTLLLLYPAKYWAVVRIRHWGWHTRGDAHAGARRTDYAAMPLHPAGEDPAHREPEPTLIP